MEQEGGVEGPSSREYHMQKGEGPRTGKDSPNHTQRIWWGFCRLVGIAKLNKWLRNQNHEVGFFRLSGDDDEEEEDDHGCGAPLWEISCVVLGTRGTASTHPWGQLIITRHVVGLQLLYYPPLFITHHFTRPTHFLSTHSTQSPSSQVHHFF